MADKLKPTKPARKPRPAGSKKSSEIETNEEVSSAGPKPAGGPKPAKKPRKVAKPAAEDVAEDSQKQSRQAKSAEAAPQSGPLEDYEEPQPSMLREFLRDSPSWLTSLIVHMALLLVLALWMLPKEIIEHPSLSFFPKEVEEEIEEIIEEPPEELEIDVSDVADALPQPEAAEIAEEVNFSPADEIEAATVKVELSPLGERTAPKSDLLTQIGAASGSGLAGRGKAARSALVRQHGGSKESELAVARALKWLANHQLPNGSWSFDHRQGACQGRCGNPGTEVGANTAATAFGVLPFLGAGQTHMEGEYKDNVRAALYYLVSQIKLTKQGGNLIGGGGRMYAHGLSAIALSEAYGMTHDQGLMAPAQSALNFCITGQDPVTGGWGYGHGKGNDTSVSGWQIMALKSGHMAYLNVPPNTVRGIIHFLDSVQADSGASYGYRSPGRGAATTAVGLLCRMYTGWKKDNPAIERGMLTMAKQGPTCHRGNGNWYRDYYAAQVMFQATGAKGEIWEQWNNTLRDGLVASQAKEGHLEGSWYGPGGHSGPGGRLYCTSLATMMLEVYYRHMPIFKEAATQEEFPIE